MRDEKSRLIYSTDTAIPRKKNNDGEAPQVTIQPPRQKVYVRLDRKGRGGKSVTLIEGLLIPVRDGEALLKQLKTRLGTGGTIRSGVFEIQGDRRDAIIELLQGMGHKPKRAGE